MNGTKKLNIIFMLFIMLLLTLNIPTTSAAANTGAGEIPTLHLVKMDVYKNGKKQTILSGDTIYRDTDVIVLTFDRQFLYSTGFVKVTDGNGNLISWIDCGRSCITTTEGEATKDIFLKPKNGPLKRNETYTFTLKSDAGTYDEISHEKLYMDTSVSLKTKDVSVENTYHINLFAQKTKPAAAVSIRLNANKDTNKIHVISMHVAQGNDLRFMLVDAKAKTTLYQSTVSAQKSFDIDIPHAGMYDLVAVYKMNDYVSAEMERVPVQMTISGQELTIPDTESSTLQFTNTNIPAVSGGEMLFSLYVAPNANVGVLVDGKSSDAVRGHWSGWQTYSVFLNVEQLKDGPHHVTFFTSAPNSSNQRMISQDILISHKDAFNDVPTAHWAHNDIERLYGLGILQGRSTGTFQPDELVTRQEFLKMLVMAANPKEKRQSFLFEDVSTSSWAKKYIDLGSSAGLIDGENVSGKRVFYPNRTISRVEAVTMMARTDLLNSLPQPHIIPAIKDVAKIQPWGVSNVKKLFYYRWIHGYKDGSFRPDQSLTRAEAAKLISSFTHDSNFPQIEGVLGYLHAEQQWIY